MTCYRYLVHFAYIGKPYRGLQIQGNCGPVSDKTVQNVLQKNLRTVLQQPSLKTSIGSRTDKGVNALSCCLHFNLPLGSTLENGKIVQPPNLEKLAKNVNVRLQLYQESVRVLKIQQVPSTFHCRFQALCRHYVYRLAIGRKDNNDSYNQAFVESAEMQWVRDSMFDTGKFIKAAEMFSGKNQFFLYKKSDKKISRVGPTERSVIVHIRRGNSLSNEYCGGSAEFWDVHIASCAFMRKQSLISKRIKQTSY
ncbi:tRNA pseudouridine synthase-like 1 isoform X2 [Mizuhopecten yessoensis]|uniref:tRNA pseudouridine synthase-like 1 isoform X2 n=1 Tax=Mizuhopecten yessoensis TaxID=6573 RepID=UPI000B45E55C|nr:tRNA pseudouridine synthase-like 1 isoform X2 [Mizuhopecten yessoensis]